jgi:hypothetical protein
VRGSYADEEPSLHRSALTRRVQVSRRSKLSSKLYQIWKPSSSILPPPDVRSQTTCPPPVLLSHLPLATLINTPLTTPMPPQPRSTTRPAAIYGVSTQTIPYSPTFTLASFVLLDPPLPRLHPPPLFTPAPISPAPRPPAEPSSGQRPCGPNANVRSPLGYASTRMGTRGGCRSKRRLRSSSAGSSGGRDWMMVKGDQRWRRGCRGGRRGKG